MADQTRLTEEQRLAEDYFYRGMARFHQYDYHRAIHHFTSAIYIQPRKATYYFHRAQARRHQGDLPGAIEDFSAAIRFDPELADAYFFRAELYRELFRLEAAIADYEQYLERCETACAEDRAMVKQIIRDLDLQRKN